MSEPILLDSNICIYLLKGMSPALADKVRQQDEGTLFVSSITVAEIGVGVAARSAQQSGFERFLAEVTVLPFDAAAARRYAGLPFRRGSFDRLIAAHALSLNLLLVTNNVRDFADLPGLRVENWTA